jgi:hypothetical protein
LGDTKCLENLFDHFSANEFFNSHIGFHQPSGLDNSP